MMRSLTALLLSGLVALPAGAAPGHDHGAEPAARAAPNSPQRQPDGSVFLPKRSQRQLGVRTLTVESRTVRRAVELAGRVIVDPGAGGRVQSTQAGRIEPGPRGMPSVGQRVTRGEVLAYVAPAVSAVERGTQQAQIAELEAQRALAEQRAARYRQLEGTVPRRDLDQAVVEAASLAERLRAVRGGLSAREALVASANGVVASMNVVAGQVIDAREVVLEIVDPTRLRIEALTYDSALATAIGEASLKRASGELVPLEVVGVVRVLREQAIPIQFRPSAGYKQPLVLSIGEPVRVAARTREQVSGVPIPASAIVRNAANEQIVWVHTSAERFVPRVVVFEPLDGESVVVTSGLAPADRVAVRGTTLINQVR
jgi:membrane fusion protein, heavy metal efflux system